MHAPVLVVEDYAALRSAIVSALERHHYPCDSVASAEDAVMRLRDHDYGTILLAPRLPIADDPVIRYLTAARPGDISKVIVMSDPSTPSGECGLLEKPFTNDALFELLDKR